MTRNMLFITMTITVIGAGLVGAAPVPGMQWVSHSATCETYDIGRTVVFDGNLVDPNERVVSWTEAAGWYGVYNYNLPVWEGNWWSGPVVNTDYPRHLDATVVLENTITYAQREVPVTADYWSRLSSEEECTSEGNCEIHLTRIHKESGFTASNAYIFSGGPPNEWDYASSGILQIGTSEELPAGSPGLFLGTDLTNSWGQVHLISLDANNPFDVYYSQGWGYYYDINELDRVTQGQVPVLAGQLVSVELLTMCGFNGWSTAQEMVFVQTLTPEPATLSLLCLGGLAILRHRSGQGLRRRKSA